MNTKSKRNKIRSIYRSQKFHSKKRGHSAPNYTKDDLIKWCLSQPLFRKLYREWRRNNYNRWFAPSCDRINDSKPYTLDNLQLMTWKENSLKAVSKEVCQYSKEGDLLETYSSTREAQKQTGVHHQNISTCCRGKRLKSAGGYKWQYQNM